MMANRHFIGIHGYMLVYSIGSKQSFEMMSIIRDKILNHLVSEQPLRGGRRLRVRALTSLSGSRYGPFDDSRQQN